MFEVETSLVEQKGTARAFTRPLGLRSALEFNLKLRKSLFLQLLH